MVKKPFKCHICGKGYYTKLLCKIHSTRRHIDTAAPDASKPYVCKRCKNYFTTDEELKGHLLAGHCDSDKGQYQCKQCDSVFASIFNYRRHLKLHTGRKPYECNVCRKRFIERYKLKNHLIRHKGYEDIVSQQIETLQIEKEQAEGHDGQYHCTVCGKRFEKNGFFEDTLEVSR